MALESDARERDPLPPLITVVWRRARNALRKVFEELRYRFSPQRQSLLLWMLAVAVERQVPLPQALMAFRRDMKAADRRRVDKLIAFLESGVSLPDALQQIPDLLPEETVLSIRVGTESGTLATVLRREAELYSTTRLRLEPSLSGTMIYFWFVLAMCVGVFSYLLLKYVPIYVQIFEGVAIRVPKILTGVVWAGEMLADWWPLLIPAILGIGWISLVYARAIDDRFRWSATSILGRRSWPYIRQRALRQATTALLRRMQIVIQAGRPIGGSLMTMARFHPNPELGRLLAVVYVNHEHGVDCWSSLRQVGLLRDREVQLLRSAEKTGSLPWALETVADRIGHGLDDHCRMTHELVTPSTLVLLGLCCGLYGLAFLLPLVELIGGVK